MALEEIICAITGESGYVGSCLASGLRQHGCSVVALSRNPKASSDIRWSFDCLDDLSSEFRSRNVSCLIHAAWDMKSSDADAGVKCVEGTRRLYENAQRAGISTIIFISTISAFEGAKSNYGKAKLEAERITAAAKGISLRLGLVYGTHSGGVYGSIEQQVRKGRMVPLIGSGKEPQYLLHQDTLDQVILRAVSGDLQPLAGHPPLTVAHPQPIPFRDLVLSIAALQGKKITLVPLPWQLLFLGLRLVETLKIKGSVRSDSVVSFVYQNPHPDFEGLRQYDIKPTPFEPYERLRA